jgi:hypothetical protein
MLMWGAPTCFSTGSVRLLKADTCAVHRAVQVSKRMGTSLHRRDVFDKHGRCVLSFRWGCMHAVFVSPGVDVLGDQAVGVLATSVWIAHGCVLRHSLFALTFCLRNHERGKRSPACCAVQKSLLVCLCTVLLLSADAQCTVPQVLWL